MITNATMITDALRDINVINERQSPSPEQLGDCLRRLNQLMEIWKEEDIDFGYFRQSDSTADCPVPDWAEIGVSTSLSIVCAPKYGATVSTELVALNDVSMNMIQRKVLAESTDNMDMSHMPIGAGYWRNRYDILFDN